MRMFMIVLLGLSLAARPAAGREWSDLSGSHRLQAELIGRDAMDGTKVRLRTDEGRTFSIQLDQLSAADRDFVLTGGSSRPTSTAGAVTTAWQPATDSGTTPPSSGSSTPRIKRTPSLFDSPTKDNSTPSGTTTPPESSAAPPFGSTPGSGAREPSMVPPDRYPAAPPPDRYPTTPPAERYPVTPPPDNRYPTSPPVDLQPSSGMPSQTTPPATTQPGANPPSATTPPPAGQMPSGLPPLPGALPPLPAEPNLPDRQPPAPSQAPAPSQPTAPPTTQSPAPPSAIQRPPAVLPEPQPQEERKPPAEEAPKSATNDKRIFSGGRSTFHLDGNEGTAAYWGQNRTGQVRQYLATLSFWMPMQSDKFIYFKSSGEGGITAWALDDEPRCGGGKVFAWFPRIGQWVFFDRDRREIPR